MTTYSKVYVYFISFSGNICEAGIDSMCPNFISLFDSSYLQHNSSGPSYEKFSQTTKLWIWLDQCYRSGDQVFIIVRIHVQLDVSLIRAPLHIVSQNIIYF